MFRTSQRLLLHIGLILCHCALCLKCSIPPSTHRSYLVSACGTAQNMCRTRVPEVPVLLHELEARRISPALFIRSLTCVIDSVVL
ncbi:uncharacterized protein F5891DRAFT_1002316 [Suillus fuscotomentosus]|uniref:Secreted protein n=1 Tax=Suillus fuscotomentosus TaxID=1912939 RepID=A0AAD4HRT8_9AGAM|nr:uncharacterized protein F5891DRAFT_1002316 [Suillus fuscotomentosus]KAG1906432.1 hypothetical protein F5891DRAFT_1002316 [Suillus fuscotomentosus]